MDPKYLREKNEEEIDIVELLKRVKEGKAPKRIDILGVKLYGIKSNMLDDFYQDMYGDSWSCIFDEINLDTKIKILDKPIIPELPKINQNEYDTNSSYRSLVVYENRYKINEIIKYINKEEK